jgi:hypothetical protein
MEISRHKIARVAGVVLVAALLTLGLTGCGPGTPAAPSHLALIAVSGAQASHAIGARSLDTPVWGRGSIDSGPPTEFTFTLKRIALDGVFDGGATIAEIWSDAEGQDITVSGSGAADLSGIADISNLPTGTVTGVKITVAAQAKITGELVDAQFSDVPGTIYSIPHLYTKSDFSYDSLNQSGGGVVADFTTGPAEQTFVYWNGGDNPVDQEISTPVSYTLTAGSDAKLTILLDVSRALRFYDGLGSQGPNPSDLANKAYFFSHSVLTNSIACFFGNPGSIDGYQTVFDVSSQLSGDPIEVDIPGWMTVVYDANGDIQSGILSGDDDNALTVAKGLITSSTQSPTGVYDFGYSISAADVTGLARVSTLGSYADAPWAQDGTTTYQFSGNARFTLKLQL